MYAQIVPLFGHLPRRYARGRRHRLCARLLGLECDRPLVHPGVFSQEAFDSVADIYEQWNFWAVFTAGFTPIPYKIFTLAAGVFHINFGMFMLASVIGRGLRFFLVGWLIWKFGTPIKSFIDKYFNLIVIAFTVLLVGGFLLIKYAF